MNSRGWKLEARRGWRQEGIKTGENGNRRNRRGWKQEKMETRET